MEKDSIILDVIGKLLSREVPCAKDYSISSTEFCQKVKDMEKNNLITNVSYGYGAGNYVIPFLRQAQVTDEGKSYFNES